MGRPAADAAFATWIEDEGHSDWGALELLASQLLPTLIAALRMVAPHTHTEALR